MDIIIYGANGRMGRILTETVRAASDAAVAARVSPSYGPEDGADAYPSLESFGGRADCVIDFSNHASTAELLRYCTERGLPAVIATTGQTEAELAMIREAAKRLPLFLSANMSVGVALAAELAKKAASVFPEAEIEIIERHHDQKLDVPSGTALLLVDRIREARGGVPVVVGRHENGRRDPREIGVHSLRYGSEVGTHEIIISTGQETITLKHEAENRALFAAGALAAARFLAGRAPGLYDMRDIVG